MFFYLLGALIAPQRKRFRCLIFYLKHMENAAVRTYIKDTPSKVKEEVSVSGWVDTIRDHGQLMFIDLRDSSGTVQLVANAEGDKEVWEAATKLGKEYVITATGVVRDRDAEMVNRNIPTGEIEVVVHKLEVHSQSKPMPFPIDTDGREIDENVRLKYRYLDMRRPRIKEIMQKKAEFIHAVRNHLHSEEFLEVTTPLLTSTSPEGARDFMIPSRLYPGKFFVLPQAPQQFKQLLMVGGVDKYFQIAPCARDEDPRADRHSGVFYQIDMEMSFPTIDKIFAACEKLLMATYHVVAPQKHVAEAPFPRMKHAEALAKYGSDKPDLRFGMELKTITEIVKDKTEFNVFNNAETIKVIVVPGAGEWSRTQIEEMETFAKLQGAAGLAYTKVTENGLDTGIAKFLQPVQSELIKATDAQPGDLLFFGADKYEKNCKIMGAVRSKLGDLLGLKDPTVLKFVWVTDFPFFEFDDKKNKIDFAHNPFSMPKGGIEGINAEDPLTVESYQYDLALNGYEVLSGSIRNHDPEILVKAFERVGYDRDTVIRRFGALYEAFQYGVPPHGGWAIGIDRMFMVLSDEPNIRDTYAFPLAANGVDLMMNAPSEVDDEDLKVVGLQIRPEVKAKMKA